MPGGGQLDAWLRAPCTWMKRWPPRTRGCARANTRPSASATTARAWSPRCWRRSSSRSSPPSPRARGRGWGWRSVFGIVSQNEGTVWAESEPGRGSTFHLLLPQQRRRRAAEPERRARPSRFDGRIGAAGRGRAATSASSCATSWNRWAWRCTRPSDGDAGRDRRRRRHEAPRPAFLRRRSCPAYRGSRWPTACAQLPSRGRGDLHVGPRRRAT